ncbi:hypothetical protein [Streptosporangium canum]|uniref:hypothetical protein n=1 Tax=Streptosporangium canum TaxID=324952 RepID=UPI0037AC1EC0
MTAPAVEVPTLTIDTVADLMVGDFLDIDGDHLLVTCLIPATRAGAVEYGAREVRSGSWWRTFDADEPVTASPGAYRLALAGGAR